MPFPRKFKRLIEIELKDVETPDYVWLTYAVCACVKDSCGWGGWMIECAMKETTERYPTYTGEKLLPAMMDQVCPRCGKGTYRTAATIRMTPSEEQKRGLVEGRDYESLPIE
ncbi:MAG: hypothetical protein ACYTAS_22140, partial [Planctomycetota bacterium]